MSVAYDLEYLLDTNPSTADRSGGGELPAGAGEPRTRLRLVTQEVSGGAAPARTAPARVAPVERSLSAGPESAGPVSAGPVSAASVAVLRAPSPSAAAAPLRLTRRGVAVLAGLTVAVAATLVWLAALSSPGAAATVVPAVTGPAVVTVQSGDTLWAIASRVAPDRDPLVEVSHLRRLNGLSDVSLTPGQTLRVR